MKAPWGIVVNATHYYCNKCGFEETTESFGYPGFSTIRCCPECGGTDLEAKRREGTPE